MFNVPYNLVILAGLNTLVSTCATCEENLLPKCDSSSLMIPRFSLVHSISIGINA